MIASLHITGKYRESAHQDCILNRSISKKNPAGFHNLQNYDSHLTLQKVGKYNFKINVVLKIIETYTSFTIQLPKKKSIKSGLPLVFIDNVHFLNKLQDNLVKNLRENDFYHLSQEFNANVLDLLNKKGFFPYH